MLEKATTSCIDCNSLHTLLETTLNILGILYNPIFCLGMAPGLLTVTHYNTNFRLTNYLV